MRIRTEESLGLPDIIDAHFIVIATCTNQMSMLFDPANFLAMGMLHLERQLYRFLCPEIQKFHELIFRACQNVLAWPIYCGYPQ